MLTCIELPVKCIRIYSGKNAGCISRVNLCLYLKIAAVYKAYSNRLSLVLVRCLSLQYDERIMLMG